MTKLKFFVFILFLGWIAQSNAQSTSRQVIYLSGKDNLQTKTWQFYCTAGRKSGAWTTIEVPSQWEQQGFGEYDYGRDYRTYGKKFKFADEKGMYRYSFKVPAEWKSRDINLVFDGSMTDTEVKINGQKAGELHQGAFYQFKFPVASKLQYGAENLLEVTVSKMSSEPSVNRAERFADYWVFGGIFRPVYLESFPREHIDRVAIDARANGHFAVDVFSKNIQGKRILKVELCDGENRIVAKNSNEISPSDSLSTVSLDVDKPALWNAENPIRYTAKISLFDGKNLLHQTSQKFGFRTIEIRQGDGIYLNGVKIKMKGINRHAFWPETGRTLNDQINLEDVKLIKSMNMNAIRCSHYPPDACFLNFCDSLGLYVIDELAGWQNSYATEPGAKLVREMVIRDANHPSIIFWANGNEGGTNKELDSHFARYDKSARPVIHPHHKPGNDFNGIDCNHYETYYSAKNIFTEGKIYMPTEFLHAQDDGGGAAGLNDFWDLFWNTPNSGGGFIWALLDEGIVRTDLGGVIDVNRVNAPDGVVGPHREKEGSYYAIRQIYSPVRIVLKDWPMEFDGKIAVENRFHFTNLKACRFEWQLVQFSSSTDRQATVKVIGTGKVAAPDVAPVSSGYLPLQLPQNYKEADALYLTAWDPSGQELFTWSWPLDIHSKVTAKMVRTNLRESDRLQRQKLKAAGVEEDNILPIEKQSGDNSKENGSVDVLENDSLLTLKASGIGVTFSKKDGKIRKVNNDLGLPLPFSNGPVLVSGSSKFENLSVEKGNGVCSVIMHYSGDIRNLIWTMYPSGWLKLSYEYQIADKVPFAGISFDFPESDIISAKWMGNGPVPVWKNRMCGNQFGVYQRLYNNKLAADNTWGLPFKGYYSNVAWAEFNTVDGKFTVVTPEKDLFLRLFHFYGISGPKNYPALPCGDLSFLDAIPPIGSKLAMGINNETWNYGPEGELTKMDKPIKRTLFFYFGLLSD